MKKKLISLAVFMLVASMFLAACGGGSNNGGTVVEKPESNGKEILKYGEILHKAASYNEMIEKYGEPKHFGNGFFAGESEPACISMEYDDLIIQIQYESLSFDSEFENDPQNPDWTIYYDDDASKLTDADKEVKGRVIWMVWTRAEITGLRGIKIGDDAAAARAKFLDYDQDSDWIYTMSDIFPSFVESTSDGEYAGAYKQEFADWPAAEDLDIGSLDADFVLCYFAFPTPPDIGEEGVVLDDLADSEMFGIYVKGGKVVAMDQGSVNLAE
ncbi:MAG: hypothetical protein FWG10_09010 [Eubacteriaceae bacterium]|nr:hypothetical protein [Eubacteriaceae bacterium]